MARQRKLNRQTQKIIDAAICLQVLGEARADTDTHIAAAFVLDRQEYLPAGYEMVAAWDQLDHTRQEYVRLIKRDHMDIIDAHY